MSKYSGLFDLGGKVALVAGGIGAIGSEMAGALCAYGAKVAIAGRSKEHAGKVAARLAGAGGETMGVALDVTDAASVGAAVAEIDEHFGPVDVLINSAGTHVEQPAEEVTVEAWDAVLSVNLRGAFLLSQAVARSEIAHGKGGSHIHVYHRAKRLCGRRRDGHAVGNR